MRPSLLLLISAVAASGRVLPEQKTQKTAAAAAQPTPLPHDVQRALYITTSINPLLSVFANEYTGVRNFRPLTLMFPGGVHGSGGDLPKQVYRTLFYFARLKPRLLFAIGACARALQMTTVLNLVFDPKIGVGAGLNMLALATGSQWPAALVLGWAMSKPVWRLLGAEPPFANVRFPINVVGVKVGGGGDGGSGSAPSR